MLIPVFNRRDLVIGAIKSALIQSVEDLDITVVDNCSDDGTWELLRAFSDRNVRIVRNQSNLGLFGNFNECARLARGEFTVFLCSDDRLARDFLSVSVQLLRAYPAATLLSSQGRNVDIRGNEGGLIASRLKPGLYEGRSVPAAWFWASYYLGENIFNYPSGVVFRTSVLRRCLPFREELGSPADIDMFLRVLQLGDLLITDKIGCFVTRHDGQEQRALRKSADLLRQELALLNLYRPLLETYNAYPDLHRQVATLILSTLVRVAKSNMRRAISLYREFDRSPLEMFRAAATRISARLKGWAVGSDDIPYLIKRL